MKARFLFSATILCLVFLPVSNAYSADKPQQKPAVRIPKAEKPVLVDGNLDEYPAYAIRMDNESFERLQYFEIGRAHV